MRGLEEASIWKLDDHDVDSNDIFILFLLHPFLSSPFYLLIYYICTEKQTKEGGRRERKCKRDYKIREDITKPKSGKNEQYIMI